MQNKFFKYKIFSRNIISRFVVLFFIFVFFFKINMTSYALTAVVYETGGAGFVKQTLTEASSFATRYSASVTATNVLATWSKRLADFSVKKIAKTMAIDLVNRMSKCIEGTGSCKSPLYLRDPVAFMGNIAASEIQLLANVASNQIVFQARMALLNANRDIRQNIGQSMKILDQYNADRLGIICSEDYIKRVGVIEGQKRKDMILVFCSRVKIDGSYISPQDIQFVHYIYSTSKTPIRDPGMILSVFSNPNAYNPNNISQNIALNAAKNIQDRQRDAKDMINGCGGYIPSTSPRETITDKNGREIALSDNINTPCGTISEQDTFARLQQARNWEKVDTIEDFFIVATDQLTQSLVNRAGREGIKIVNGVTVKINESITGLANDFQRSANDLATDLRCATGDEFCKKKQNDINNAVNFTTDNEIKNIKEIIYQRDQKNQNSYGKIKKSIVSKNYYKVKLDNAVRVSQASIESLESALNYYNTAVSITSYPMINRDLNNAKIDLNNKIVEISNKRDLYQSKLNIINSDIKDLKDVEVELLNLVGDNELYPNLNNKSIYKQCIAKVDDKTIKNIMTLKNVIIKKGSNNYITENLSVFGNLTPFEYNCDVDSPLKKDYMNIENIAIKEEYEYVQRINYERAMQDPNQNSQADMYNLDDNFKVFHQINTYVNDLARDAFLNRHKTPQSYIDSLINTYYPPASSLF